jgi:hypothetical protein
VTGDEGDGPYCADGFYAWGGFLYSWCCNMIRYTNGGHSTCDEETVPPNVAYDPLNPAPGWQWTEVQIGPCDACECINGMAGTFLGSLGQSRLYVSTPSQLYAILPGDIVMSMISWSGADIDNGRGMVTYNGSAYAPVGDGLFASRATVRLSKSESIAGMAYPVAWRVSTRQASSPTTACYPW